MFVHIFILFRVFEPISINLIFKFDKNYENRIIKLTPKFEEKLKDIVSKKKLLKTQSKNII